MAKKDLKNINGWIFFNKPLGMSSQRAVTFVKYAFQAKKAGHGGTLDPLASGVLPIALGEATKVMQFMLNHDKSYQFTVQWGSETTTYDAEGEITRTSEAEKSRPTQSQIEAIINNFTGEISQTPPVYSALKINGKTAYQRARDGEKIDMTNKTRQVKIYDLQLLNCDTDKNQATFIADVSKGTYIRSLGRDMGVELSCYGHIVELIRTKVADIELNDTVSQQTLEKYSKSAIDNNNLDEDLQNILQKTDSVLIDISAWVATDEEAELLSRGMKIPARVGLSAGVYRVHNSQEELISMVEIDGDGEVKIIRNINL